MKTREMLPDPDRMEKEREDLLASLEDAEDRGDEETASRLRAELFDVESELGGVRTEGVAPTSETPSLSYFQAGGNMGGDCDANGDPVIAGKWYATLMEDDWNGQIISGAFDSEDDVRSLLNLPPVSIREHWDNRLEVA